MCSTPPRIIRGRRNASQTASALQSERLDQPITIQIASDLIDAFKEISEGNSIEKKETGAILAGYKVNDHYALFVPQQVRFADRFEATDELDIDNFFIQNPGMVLLGVIHTHPGFESFLSSVDLHMLFNYACTNHAIVSIVLAPELNTFPAYTLTRKGMDVLRTCQRTGFHRHK